MKKILIIDDDQVVANLYKDKFQTEGFEAEIAEDGKTAIEKLKLVSSPPDVVLLDLLLPDVNGVEVLKFIRSQPATRSLPVIVLSNVYPKTMVQAAWDAGANKCLAKSKWTPGDVAEEVRGMLTAIAGGSQVQRPVPAAPDAGGETVSSAGTATRETPMGKASPSRMSALLKELRPLMKNLVKSDADNRPPRLLELYGGIRSLAGAASAAGFPIIARLGSALEELVHELCAKPRYVNYSSLHTVGQAVDLLAALVEQADKVPEEAIVSPQILVLDDEPISRETICTALEKVDLQAISMDDPGKALMLMRESRFDLVFLDVDMPGLNGFEVCEKLQSTPLNLTTPVVFVTARADFESRTQSTLSGGTDFITKPIMLIELAVKALIHLHRISPVPV